jgi:hypothetical protein
MPELVDPMVQLAFTLYQAPGTYALLLGSGVSTGAGIPTGWDITLDLIRQLAALEGADEEAQTDPEGWFQSAKSADISYSDLLEALAPDELARQRLVSRYVLRGSSQGAAEPTEAHRAIATMLADSVVSIVLTTNFDPLLEQACADIGLSLRSLSTSDDIVGAPPIHACGPVQIKLHGDYRDTRIKNIGGELAHYDAVVDNLLDQILDGWGLIVCGWSATWDVALRSALLRSPVRRWTTYWAHKGALTEEAAELIAARDAVPIEIGSADSFFSDLTGKIEALRRFESARHPLSSQLAVEELKHFLNDPVRQPRVHDLVMREARRVHDATGPEQFPTQHDGSPIEHTLLREKVAHYEHLSETLARLVATGCFFSDDAAHDRLWVAALEMIVDPRNTWGGSRLLLQLRRYPALVVLYCGGVAAVATQHYSTLRSLLLSAQFPDTNGPTSFVEAVSPVAVNGGGERANWIVADGDRHFAPVQFHLEPIVESLVNDLIPSRAAYVMALDLFEYLFGLISLTHKKDGTAWSWAPIGSFQWRDQYSFSSDKGPGAFVRNELETRGDASPMLRSGLFGEGAAVDGALEDVRKFEEFLQENGRRF